MTFLKNKLLEQIKEGEIKLKPKWVFGFRILGLLIGSIMSILITIFFVSIVLFMVFYNSNTLQNRDLLTFRMVFTTLPWLIILLSVVFVVIFEFFAKKLLPLYRKPMIVSLAVLGLLIFAVSFGINQSKAFKNLCACNSRVKPLEWMFQKHNKTHDSLIKKGKIKEIQNKIVIVELEDGQILKMNMNMFCKHCINNLSIDEDVIVSGFNTKNGFKPFKGKKGLNNCNDCELKNEIKLNNSCNNIWKGRKARQN